MKIKSLVLNNFCQHKHLELNFSFGLNGILGHNGAGKSNVLAAIQYGLTGTTRDNLENYISKTMPDNETCSVKITVVSDVSGNEVSITRSISPRRVTVEATDGTHIRRASDASAYLFEQFGLDENVLKNIQIVPQEEIVAFFGLQPSIRTNILQRIYGVDLFQHRRDGLRNLLSSIRAATDIRKELDTHCDMRKARELTLEQYKDLPDPAVLDKEIVEVSEELRKVEAALSHESAYSFVLAEKARYEASIAATQRALANAQVGYSEEERVKCTTVLSALKQEQDSLEAEKKVLSVECRSRIPALLDHLANLRLVLRELEVFDASELSMYESLDEERRLNRTLYNQVVPSVATGACPVCGREYPEAQERYDRLEEEYSVLMPRYVHAKALYDEYVALMGRLSVAADRFFQAFGWSEDKPGYAETRDLCDILEKLKSEKSLLSVVGCIKKLDLVECALQDTVTRLDERLDVVCTKLESVCASYAESVARQEGLIKASQIIESCISKITIEEQGLQAILNSEILRTAPVGNSEELKARRTELSSRLTTCQDTKTKYSARDLVQHDLAVLNKKIKAMEKRITQDKELSDYRAELDQLLTLLHPDNLPRAAIIGMSKAVMANLNAYLTMFSADFSVTMDQNTDLHCAFQNGIEQPASRLSGGQKVVLALAWRLSLHATFSTDESCGFLTLDEPTTFLDEANIDNLTNVIQQIRDLAVARNIQILIVTHEQSLSPLFDNVIQL